MSWARHPLCLYVVAWPDGVFKVGITERRRWRGFELRGAELLYLKATPDACEIETAIHEHLRLAADPAFQTSAEAVSHLGVGGGGYLECYRPCSGTAQADAQASQVEQTTHERTDVLTNVLVTTEDISPLSDARSARRKDRP